MALATAVISFDISDLVGAGFDASKVRAWTTTNADNNRLLDTAANLVRVGDGKATVNNDGTGSFDVWVPGPDGNPTSWQQSFIFEYPLPGARGRTQATFGPYTISGSANLADLEAQQAIPPTYLSEVTGALSGYVDDAADSAAAAAASAASAYDISNISTSDGVVSTLVGNPDSDTAVALATSIAAPLGLDTPVVWGDGEVRANFEHDNPDGGYLQHLYTGATSSTDTVFGSAGTLYAAGVGDGGDTTTNGYLASLKNCETGDGFVAVNQPNTTGHGYAGLQQSTVAALMQLQSVNSTGTAAPLVELIAAGNPGANQKLERWLSADVSNGDFGTLIAEVRTDGTFDTMGLFRSNGGVIRAQRRDTGGTFTDITHADLYAGTDDETHLQMARTIGGGNKFFMYELGSAYSKASLRAAHYDAMTTYVDAVSWGITGSGGTATLGFYGHAVTAQQVLATGASRTVDDIITALQGLGLVKQS